MDNLMGILCNNTVWGCKLGYVRHFSYLKRSATWWWNCQCVFYSPVLSKWGSWNSSKFSGIQLQSTENDRFCYYRFHCTFHSTSEIIFFYFSFLSKPTFPTTRAVARSDTIFITLPTTYLHTILQQSWLEHPAFGDSLNEIYPLRQTWFMCCRLYTFCSVLAHTFHIEY